ncbi:MAG: nucleotide sugar dehydrogenase [Myxococcales bacterium]|nr:nucleotide sugar dehydrogenase [Myxococcales bacterium]
MVVIGLGYVGLPVAIAMAKKYDCIGFDINQSRIDELRAGHDRTNEVEDADLQASNMTFTNKIEDIKGRSFYIVAVPTPIDIDKRPDLTPVEAASRTVAKALTKGAVIVYESTVYPGVTEDVCGPILEAGSGLKCGEDIFLGYSPERINPGDKVHTFETIIKVVAGQDDATLERVAKVYESVVDAGVHRAATIKVAEAAKVIENTQRDVNIALMNELALIFDLVGIRTKDVLEAAGTKWNFLKFGPGLVGGHCIGVDPYYLTAKAEQLGYQPQVILSGRSINNGVGAYVAQRTMKMMSKSDVPLRRARVGILGLTFKENVPDLRNSRVPDVVAELREFGINPLIHDAMADKDEAFEEYGIRLSEWADMGELDALILAVGHDAYLKDGPTALKELMAKGAVCVDVKSMLEPSDFADYNYWSL